MTDTTDRAGYITGLRRLADLLEQTPELPLPHYGRPNTQPLALYLFGGYGTNPAVTRDQYAAAAAALAAAAPDARPHYQPKGTLYGGPDILKVLATLDGLHLELAGEAEVVGEKVVTGTQTVEVDQVEWSIPGVPTPPPAPAADDAPGPVPTTIPVGADAATGKTASSFDGAALADLVGTPDPSLTR